MSEALETELTHIALSPASLLESLIDEAVARKASDIHIDPREDTTRVRLRIDGALSDSAPFPKRVHAEIIARIKVLSRLRSDEHQSTQDGRFRHIRKSGGFADVRVSIIPTYHGENAVLRILSDAAEAYSLESLGFSNADEQKILESIRRSSGMILATGPTGSGKTTTLYTLVKLLNKKDISIVTIEDPIEYAVEGIEQIQANHRTGLTFANGLRSILRQDPNVIMVGEIRDPETAAIAVNTALTGHLLLSTLHTSDAATSIPRLLDMGIEAYLVASTVSLIIGQRLVRKVCQQCKKKKVCTACGQTGFDGRISINEVMIVDPVMRNAISAKLPASELRSLAIQKGMRTMLEDGMQKVKLGLTTLEEVLRVVHD